MREAADRRWHPNELSLEYNEYYLAKFLLSREEPETKPHGNHVGVHLSE